MPSIPFAKASACGNDFLVIDISHAGANVAELTRRLCDRHNGVGADGVEWLVPAKEADIEARLINADGSEAELSGNGTRCVAACIAEHGGSETIRVLTGAGVKTCELIARRGTNFEFKTAMGKPEISGEVAVNGMRGLKVSTGNPHFVVMVDEFAQGWQAAADGAARTSHFPKGTNVEFVNVRDRHHIDVRLYERGVGETQSSGTGSCASAVAAIHTGHCDSPVQVTTLGGTQTVAWDGEITLTGPATIVCTGQFFI
ncbi:MAG TPA: diaminopimelate epimerase [Candidatus Koribacter sp.]|jgi:diaminopimelate epimerase